MVIIQRELRKVGNSIVVRMPVEILEKLNASEGDNLEFITEGDAVLIRKQEDYDQEIMDLSNEMFGKYDKTMHDLRRR